MAAVKSEKLIFVDLKANSNKFYFMDLLADGTVQCRWGRYVAGSDNQVKSQEEMSYSGGEYTFNKKLREKLKKGYVQLKVVDTSAQPAGTPVAKTNLESIALKQIRYTNAAVPDFVKYLCQTNVHRIEGATALKYNEDTGSFTTPFGIVNQQGIDEARNHLAEVNRWLTNPTSEEFEQAVTNYMRVIPQDVGRSKISASRVFPNLLAVQQQNDVLDGLEASLTEVLKPKPKAEDKEEEIEEPKLFDTDLDLLEDDKEIERIKKLFKDTAKDMHYSVKGMSIKRIFKVNIAPMSEAYETNGKSMGNTKELWHGTGTANLLSILKTGFKVSPPSTAAIAGKMFGNGLYFAIHSTKSLQYARGVWHGNTRNSKCYMFLNDIALGNFYVPQRSTSSNPPSGYHSYWAQPGKSGIMNDEIIVFREHQVYPKYLLEIED
jgi:poly [ADP-ribose] polymerase